MSLWPMTQASAQTSYIVEQIGRDAHHIVQSLGAFVGNERAESQSFDITYMPPGNGVEGVVIINTADYRATFKMDPMDGICYQILLDTRSVAFLADFNLLFSVYPSEIISETARIIHFGDRQIRIEEKTSGSAKKRCFVIE
ncbi:MAG: hypothetical protein SPJ13_00260 [Bacteroidales bacterium]|nr:hypothetical protein [Bacteroidales bacterium]